MPYLDYDQNQDKTQNQDTCVHVNAVTDSSSLIFILGTKIEIFAISCLIFGRYFTFKLSIKKIVKLLTSYS